MASNVTFVPELKEDSERFIDKVHDWLVELLDKNVTAGDLKTKTKIKVFAKGESADFQKPCGSLITQNGFRILEPYLSDPMNARIKTKSMEKYLWHPTQECLDRHKTIEMDGGDFAHFNITCDGSENVLLNAMVGSVTIESRYLEQSKGAVFVKLEMLNELLFVFAARKHLRPTTVQIKSFPHQYKETLEAFHDSVRQCATNGSLELHGIVGGAWRQLYESKEAKSSTNGTVTFDSSVLAYMDAFLISNATIIENNQTSPASTPTALSAATNILLEKTNWGTSMFSNSIDYCEQQETHDPCLISHAMKSFGTQLPDFWSNSEVNSPHHNTTFLYAFCALLFAVAIISFRKIRTRRAGYEAIPASI